MKRFQTILTEQGYRVTPQRLAIYEALANSTKHPSAEDLYLQVRDQYPMISPATVYNTLQLLVQLGLATELGFPGETRYDGNVHLHANIQCIRCKQIFDVDLPDLVDLEDYLAKKSDFVLLGQRHEFFGVCPACQSSEASPSAG